MTMARVCDACHKTIASPTVYFNVLVMKKLADREDEQNPIHQQEGDYCHECMINNAAMQDLMADINAVKLDNER